MPFLSAFSLPTWIAIAGGMGLLIGSFLNVVILRLPERLLYAWKTEARDLLETPEDQQGSPVPGSETVATKPPPGIVREPSHCPSCKHRLAVVDNIPVLSWLWLRGRCRYCQAPISVQYPLVELLTAILSAVVIWRFGATLPGLLALFFTWMLIAASGIDLRTHLLPDNLTQPLLWIGLLAALAKVFIHPQAAILGAVFGYLSLWSIYQLFKLLTGKEGMGYGDFKLLAALGAWMGPVALLPIVLISSLIGAIAGSIYLAVRGKERGAPIPFGPYLAIAGWIWLLAGSDLLHWYLSLFLQS